MIRDREPDPMNMRPEEHSIVASQAVLLICVVLIIACSEVTLRLFHFVAAAMQ